MKRVWLIGSLFCWFTFLGNALWAQHLEDVSAGDSVYAKAMLNHKDSKGQKQGLWYIDQKPEFDQNGYIAFGRYVDNLKEGLWYRMDHLGRLIWIERFANGVLDGTSQYYDKGNLVCIGNFRGLNPKYKIDSFWVTNPITDNDTLIMVPSERGAVKHGLWRYYSPISGQLIKEEKYQIGQLLYQKEFRQNEMADSVYFDQLPQHRPVDTKRVYHKVPARAKREIGY